MRSDKPVDYRQPQLTESFDELEILGETPDAAGTHIEGSQIYTNGA